MSAVKDEAIRMIHALPDDCTLEDIEYRLYVLKSVQAGLSDIEAGRLIPQDEVERRVKSWFKSSGPSEP